MAVVTSEQAYIANVTLHQLKEATNSNTHIGELLNTQANDQVFANIEQSIESIMPSVLRSKGQLPVTEEDGRYVGVLQKEQLAKLLDGM